MDGDFDQFEEVDDDFLAAIPLDEVTVGLDKPPGKEGFETDLPVAVPEEFAFPFPPYDIQVGFMKALYKALELGKIGIFESPTGTGKSLSLICGALRWLKDDADRQRAELDALLTAETGGCGGVASVAVKEEKPETKGFDWIQDFVRQKEVDEKAKKLKEEQEALKKREDKLKQLRTVTPQVYKHKRKRDSLDSQFSELFKDAPAELRQQMAAELGADANDDGENSSKTLEDEDLVLEDYHSEEEEDRRKEDEEDDLGEQVTKIFYCSRTHSQISQFVHEVQKSPYGPDTQVISLGSRQNLCVNESVKKMKSLNLINDRCLELQKKKAKKREGGEKKRQKAPTVGCPYYNKDLLGDYKDKALASVRDIEQLVTLGKEVKACPYYGTRHAVPMAELVALPYNTLLHKSTREACGIKLKDNIIIIDEAHNLIDTIGNIHSVEVTGAQLTCAYSQLTQYQDRYRSRLKAKNLMYIRQIIFLLATFIKTLGGKTGIPADQQKLPKPGTRLQTINDFLFDAHMDNMNLFKVLRYLEKSNIARKLHGFVERHQPQVNIKESKKEEGSGLTRFLKEMSQPKNTVSDNQTDSQDEATKDSDTSPRFTSPLMQITGFLEALTNADKDGRMVCNTRDLLSKSSLKFLLLNPAVYFESILAEARAVIVAGGTMEPLSEFKDQLFYAAGVAPERILQYSCGHVIGPDQLLPIALARGPSGVELDFTYQQRETPTMMDELGRVVYNACTIVPGGVVCFFPSYDYERTVHDHWEKTGHLAKMCAKKKLYREPKKANQVDQVLEDYSAFIRKHENNKYSSYTGALIFCVVGGKMSEGINFSDSLGRGVLMVGLPYPNIRSPELKEKMDYLNSNMPKSEDGRTAGQVHYENLCMKAVNQSIGRAIRHKLDHATILLLDKRYLRPSMATRLPAWISGKLRNMDRFGPTFAALRKFFADRKAESENTQS